MSTKQFDREDLQNGEILDNLCYLWTIIKKLYGALRGFMRPTEIALGTALTPKCTWSTQQKVVHIIFFILRAGRARLLRWL